MRNRETEQKDILLMTAFFKAGGDLQIYYVVGLALFFDLFPTCCRQPDLYPICGGKEHGVKSVHPLARHISVMKYT